MWHMTADGSIVGGAANVLFFSTERFVDDICLGNAASSAARTQMKNLSIMSTFCLSGYCVGTTYFREQSLCQMNVPLDMIDTPFRAV